MANKDEVEELEDDDQVLCPMHLVRNQLSRVRNQLPLVQNQCEIS